MTSSNNSRNFSWRVALVISLSAGLLALALSIVFQSQGLAAGALIGTRAPEAATASAGHGSAAEVPGVPVRLIIPSLGIDAHVQSVGLAWQDNRSMGIPTNFTDVGWYKYGPRPGAFGSAVMDGHLDGEDVEEAVFHNIDKLTIGDLVEVLDADGTTWQFRVVEIRTYAYDAPTEDIFSADTSTARLNLITCTGSWLQAAETYDERIVIFSELVTTY